MLVRGMRSERGTPEGQWGKWRVNMARARSA